MPGRALLRLDPGAIKTLSRRLQRGSVVVSATNGKTTTSAMLASVLAAMAVQGTVARAVADGVVKARLPCARTAKGGLGRRARKLLRFALEDPLDLFLKSPAERNLSCSLSISWPSRSLGRPPSLQPLRYHCLPSEHS